METARSQVRVIVSRNSVLRKILPDPLHLRAFACVGNREYFADDRLITNGPRQFPHLTKTIKNLLFSRSPEIFLDNTLKRLPVTSSNKADHIACRSVPQHQDILVYPKRRPFPAALWNVKILRLFLICVTGLSRIDMLPVSTDQPQPVMTDDMNGPST
ncbi:hypothetical protein NKW54_12060 [Acetobacter cerevisiae]|uniref:Uncharacterized protein n=1 Tax=Acetobacter cerevisiae TaxID=178900 RepID=A0ABT1EXI9_9PROT|nr:hypothetical protein [Acetobacter cerevisiae]MCP1246670.1 hypothetical protein [Acetobacter cerevisiae]MCP1256229.1 hypothetical protein [Acetobacter cerevisiae]